MNILHRNPELNVIPADPNLHLGSLVYLYLRECTNRKRVELFKYSGSAPVKLYIFLKNEVNTGNSKYRIASNGFYSGNTEQGCC